LEILSGGIMGGTLAAWGGLFATILAPLSYSDIQYGKIFLAVRNRLHRFNITQRDSD